MNCYPKPIGCGREIPSEEFLTWDALSQKEFQISSLCLDPCQNEYFAEEDEEGDWESDPHFDWEAPF